MALTGWGSSSRYARPWNGWARRKAPVPEAPATGSCQPSPLNAAIPEYPPGPSSIPSPRFDDNYIGLLRQEGGFDAQALVVDPGDEEPVIAALTTRAAAGLAAILSHPSPPGPYQAGWTPPPPWPQARVSGPGTMRIRRGHGPRWGKAMSSGRRQGPGCALLRSWRVLAAIPRPTPPIGEPGPSSAGIPSWRWLRAGLRRHLRPARRLPGADRQSADAETQVYCAHEYTLANLGFAGSWVELDSPAPAERTARARGRRAWPNSDKRALRLRRGTGHQSLPAHRRAGGQGEGGGGRRDRDQDQRPGLDCLQRGGWKDERYYRREVASAAPSASRYNAAVSG